MMGNDELKEFSTADLDSRIWIQDYDTLLTAIAVSSIITIPWSFLKEIVKTKIHLNIATDPLLLVKKPSQTDKNGISVSDYKLRIFECLDILDRTPFTIQRLCELCERPMENHKQVFKYLRALEKVVNVSSSIDDFEPMENINSPSVIKTGDDMDIDE